MRLTIGKKITVSFVFLLAMATGIMGVVLNGLYEIKQALRDVVEVHEPIRAAAYEMEINVIGVGFGVMKYLETGAPQYRARVEKDTDDFARFYNQYDRLVREAGLVEGITLGAQIESSFKEFRGLGETLMAQKDELTAIAGRMGRATQESQKLNGRMKENILAFVVLRERLDEILDSKIQVLAMRKLDAAKGQAEQPSLRVIRLLGILIPLLLVLKTGVGFFLFRSITGPLERLLQGVEAARRGDLSHRVPLPTNPIHTDELSDVTENFNRMVSQLEATTVSKTALEASDRELRLTVATLHSEIVERISAEDKAQAAEDKYRSIFENAVEGIFQSTPAGRFISVNPAMARLHGYETAEAMIAEITDIKNMYVEPAQRDVFRHLLERQGYVHGFETQCSRKDGSPIWVAITARVVRDEQGAVQFYEGTVSEITERKRLETQLLHAQKMEAVGRLAGGIAHDFNNVLTAIMGYSALLMSSLGSAETRRNHAEQITKTTERAAALTRQLLAFSRKQVLVLKTLDLNAVVRAVEPMLQRLIGEDITLRVMLSQADMRCKSDAGQLDQVIMNLAVNARDAMPQGGTLTLQTEPITLDEAAVTQTSRGWHGPVLPGAYVMLLVSDTGCGMDLETQSKIFEPFFTTKEVGQGTGLGLSTVYGIVKQSGGHIWVYSEVGLGTTFKIYLPHTDAEDLQAQPEAAAAPTGGTETVLLVEDDEAIRDLATAVLKQEGYCLLQANSAEAAINLSGQYGDVIHLLVTDVVMSGMSGRELAMRLKPLRPAMKVLYMSGYTDDAIVRHGIQTEALTFLQKPFTLDALTKKVRELLDS